MRKHIHSGAVLLAFAFTACGGGGSSNSPLPGGNGGATGTLSISITIPAKRTGAIRRPHFVSPSTQSMSIAITGPTNVNPPPVNFTPSSPNCTVGSNGLVCQTQVTQLQPGGYTATISTFDQQNATGNVLSTAQTVAFTIKSGITNAVLLTLSGVPRSIVVTPASAVNTIFTGGTSYAIIGTLIHTFTVEALDAGGNAIVGQGAPVFSVAQTSGTFVPVLVQPSTTAPNAIGVAPPPNWPSAFTSAALTVSASFAGQATNGCAISGAVCSAQITISPRELMVVSDDSGALSTLHVYNITSGTPVLVTSLSITGGTNVAKFDPTGNLFAGPNPVHATNPVEFAAPTYTTPSTVTVLGKLGDFFFSPDGTTMYAFDLGKTGIQSYNIAAGTLNNPIVGPPLPLPGTLTMSFDGSVLYDADEIDNFVLPIKTAHNGIQPPLPLPASCTPKGIAISPDGNRLFATCNGNNNLAIVLVSTGATTTVATGVAPLVPAYDPVTADVCVPNSTSGSATLIHDNGNGSGNGVATLVVGTTPRAAAMDANGNCWVANFGSGTGNGTVSEFNVQSHSVVTTPLASGIGNAIYINILP